MANRCPIARFLVRHVDGRAPTPHAILTAHSAALVAANRIWDRGRQSSSPSLRPLKKASTGSRMREFLPSMQHHWAVSWANQSSTGTVPGNTGWH